MIGSCNPGSGSPVHQDSGRSSQLPPTVEAETPSISKVNVDLLAAAKRAKRLLTVIARNIEPGATANPVRDVVEHLEAAIRRAEEQMGR